MTARQLQMHVWIKAGSNPLEVRSPVRSGRPFRQEVTAVACRGLAMQRYDGLSQAASEAGWVSADHAVYSVPLGSEQQ